MNYVLLLTLVFVRLKHQITTHSNLDNPTLPQSQQQDVPTTGSKELQELVHPLLYQMDLFSM